MAYELPITKAIQCIPEFRGAVAELGGFTFQIDNFAELIAEKQEGEAHANENTAIEKTEEELIHVVLSKIERSSCIAV